MCLIVAGWQVCPDYPLVVAANRDEFHARPSAPISRWPDAAHILGGRDLEAGGTWLAVGPNGRFAAITNVREPGSPKGQISRGELPRQFLLSGPSPQEYAASIDPSAFSGFNLLVGDRDSLFFISNRDGAARKLPPGIYGLSNHTLDTPWPKLVQARAEFAKALTALPKTEAFFELLGNRTVYPDGALPDTGVSLEWERRLSAIFVRSEHYGTRASTLVIRHRDGTTTLQERCFDAAGETVQSSVISTSE